MVKRRGLRRQLVRNKEVSEQVTSAEELVK